VERGQAAAAAAVLRDLHGDAIAIPACPAPAVHDSVRLKALTLLAAAKVPAEDAERPLRLGGKGRHGVECCGERLAVLAVPSPQQKGV
jgi:hypothetical protein